MTDKWYKEVSDEFYRLFEADLVASPDHVEPLYDRAVSEIESSEEALGMEFGPLEAATRTALAVAALAWGNGPGSVEVAK